VSFSIGVPLGGTGRGHCSAGTLRERGDFDLSGGLVYWKIQEIYKKKKLWKWASISIGAPLGNLEEGSFTGDFERE